MAAPAMIAMSNTSIERPVGEGFTLLELLVVLAIMALLLTLAATSLVRSDRTARHSEMALLRKLAQGARATAVLTGQSVVLSMDKLPPDLAVEPSDSKLQWFADGSATATKVMRGGSVVAEIEPVSGRLIAP